MTKSEVAKNNHSHESIFYNVSSFNFFTNSYLIANIMYLIKDVITATKNCVIAKKVAKTKNSGLYQDN